jgi:hypothetical protein
MIEQFKSWKFAVERLWSTAAIDWDEAARLATEIAANSTDEILRQAATQAMPILRSACLDGDDHSTMEAARRRLCIVLDVLQQLTAPRFGKRDVAPKPLTPEERARQMLGLPFDRHLARAEIHHAFRRAAKTRHPDAGGNAKAFLELAAARDALMRPAGKKGG